MLVLTRKSRDSIMIGDEIEIIVVAINGGKVRLGIDAPRDVPVLRGELYSGIQAEQRAKDTAAKE